jgi:hypothetical protein
MAEVTETHVDGDKRVTGWRMALGLSRPYRRWLVGALVVLLIASGGIGYVVYRVQRDCLPAQPSVTPAAAVPGQVVKVSSTGFPCKRRLAAHTTYRIVLLPQKIGPVDLGPFPVNRDGSFAVPVRIPTGFPPGRVLIGISGSPFDRLRCDGTASCIGYGTDMAVI